MTNKQPIFEIVEEIPSKIDNKKYLKQKWRNKLQRYCDNQAIIVGDVSGWCVCGYMRFCDNCKHCGETNACVKAIIEYCKENNIEIDYNNYDFEKILKDLEGITDD